MRPHAVTTGCLGLVLLLTACSGSPGAAPAPSTTAAPPATASPTTLPPAPDAGVLYVLTAIGAEVRPEAQSDGYEVTISGTQRRTQWIRDQDAGVVSTADLTGQWPGLGLDREPPQAAFVPADPGEPGVLLSLTEPRWDEATRLLRFRAKVPGTPDPRLAGLVPDLREEPTGPLGVVTVFVHHPAAEDVPTPTPTTSTTVTAGTSPTTEPTDGTLPTTTTAGPLPTTTLPGVPTTPVPPVVPSTVVVEPPPPPTNPPPPTDGQPILRASTDRLRIPSGGGSRSFTLRNVGTGVGSWATTATYSTGIRVAPSSGFLLPGSQTTVDVRYDGTHITDDFTTPLVIVTGQGSITVLLEVRGDA